MFKDPALQTQIERDGYLLLPMLGPEEVEAFRELFFEITDEKEVRGIHSNVVRNKQEDNRRVGDFIQKIFQPHIERLFDDCHFAGGTFLVKGMGDDSECALHQDWNNVDETKFLSLNIWCALEDVNDQNGTLEVLPGSHQVFPGIRSATIPTLFLDFDEQVEPFVRQAILKAGEVCIYTHNVFHGSRANNSNNIRLAVVCGVQANQSKHLHYYKAPEAESPIEVFEIDGRFFYDEMSAVVAGAKPKGYTKIAEIREPVATFQKEEALRRIAASLPIQPRAFASEDLQSRFNRDGYLIFDGLSGEALLRLKNCFEQMNPGINQGFYAGFNSLDPEFKSVGSAEIIASAWPLLKEVLPRHRPLFATYAIKEPGENSIIPPHQDWNFVEDGDLSFNFWFPIEPVSPEQGQLWVMPGSHRLFPERISGPNLAKYSPSAHYEKGFLEKYMLPLDLKPGQGVLIDHRLVHSSPPNRADKRRLAASMCIIPQGAPTIHITGMPDGRIEKFEVDDAFFTKVAIGQGRNSAEFANRSLGEVRDIRKPCSAKAIEAFYVNFV